MTVLIIFKRTLKKMQNKQPCNDIIQSFVCVLSYKLPEYQLSVSSIFLFCLKKVQTKEVVFFVNISFLLFYIFIMMFVFISIYNLNCEREMENYFYI